MRLARILSAMLAFALLGVLPFAVSPADATARHTAARSATQVHVGAKIVKKHHGLYMVGNVKPPKGPVIISKATKCNKRTAVCNFKRYKKVKLQKKGHYSAKVIAPKHGNLYWQARVGTHKSAIWVTCKTLTGSCAS